MKRLVNLLGLALVAVLVALAATPVGESEAAAPQQRPMMWHAQSGNSGPVGPMAVAGLVRRGTGVSYWLRTEGLVPGHAYTIWFVAANSPSNCAPSPCTAPDLINNPAVNAQVTYGGGFVAGSSGKIGFGGAMPVGVIENGWLADRGLESPQSAEIHLVLNDHGPVIPDMMPEMIQTYRAGCTDSSLPGVFPPTAKADGEPGPNICRLYQSVIFQ